MRPVGVFVSFRVVYSMKHMIEILSALVSAYAQVRAVDDSLVISWLPL